MRHHSKSRKFLIDALEPRLLMANFAYVTITSPLQTSGTTSITAIPGQPVEFDVQVLGYMAGGAAGPAPTGTVTIHEVNDADLLNSFLQVNLSGGAVSAGGTTATASGTIPVYDSATSSPSYQAYVYADYSGDANYNETLSSGQIVENGGNVIDVNFPAMQYVFTTQPTNTSANVPISPAVAVAYEDPTGAVDPYFNGAVTLGVATAPTGGKIAAPSNSSSGELYNNGGYVTVNAVSGVATFPDVEFTVGGTYTLTESVGGGVDMQGYSSSFVVGVSNALMFVQAPSNGAVGMAIQPTVTVELLDPTKAVITSDSSTVITLTPVGYTGNSPVTGNTATLVNGIASFPNLTFPQKGSYTLQATDAANDTPATSTKFGVSGGTLTLTINSRSTHKTAGVETGDVVFYDLNVTSKKSITSSVITETLPAGFTPMSISAGGTFANSVITWNTSDHDVSFDYIVPGATVLAPLKAIVTTGAATSTYSDMTTDDATATDTVKIAGSLKITGNLHDVQFQYPNKLSLAEPALGGIVVQLIDPSDGTVIDSQKTSGSGAFTLTAKLAGTYQLLFTPIVQTYSSTSNGYSSSTAYVGMSVTIPMGQTKPLALGDLYLPKTFFTTASTILNSLNNYTTSGFQNLAAFKIDLLQFDTSAPEAQVNALLGSSTSPTPLLNEASLKIGGPTDPWVTAIRSLAACATINSRFFDTFRVADQAGKAAAVLASAAVARQLGKTVGGINKNNATLGQSISNSLGSGFRLASVATVDAKLATATRIAGFTALGATLPTLLDSLGISGSSKNTVLATLFNVLRYASDLLTGSLIGDLGFEAVFNLIRITTDSALLEVLTGVQLRSDLPAPYSLIATALNSIDINVVTGASFQSAITLSSSLVYNTNTDTQQVLSALDKYDGAQHDTVTIVQTATSPINSFASLVNGINGVLAVQQVATQIGGAGTLTGFQSGLQSVLTKAQGAINKVAGVAGSSAAKAGNQLALAALGIGTGGVVSQALAVTFIPNLAANSVLVGTSSVLSGSLPSTTTTKANSPVFASAVVTPAAAVASSDVTNYVADLRSMSTLVKKHDTTDIPALYTTMSTDDNTLFANDLATLDGQAFAVFSQGNKAQQTAMAQFDAALNEAESATLLANLQLSAWSAAPATGNTAAVVAQFNIAAAAVQTASQDSVVVRSFLNGKSVPAALEISETALPSDAAIGSTQTITVSIVNVGDVATSAGTVTFTNDDGGLTVQGGSQQMLSALDAGGSASFSFTVLVSTPSNGDPAPAFQIVAAAGDQTAQITDTVTLD